MNGRTRAVHGVAGDRHVIVRRRAVDRERVVRIAAAIDRQRSGERRIRRERIIARAAIQRGRRTERVDRESIVARITIGDQLAAAVAVDGERVVVRAAAQRNAAAVAIDREDVVARIAGRRQRSTVAVDGEGVRTRAAVEIQRNTAAVDGERVRRAAAIQISRHAVAVQSKGRWTARIDNQFFDRLVTDSCARAINREARDDEIIARLRFAVHDECVAGERVGFTKNRQRRLQRRVVDDERVVAIAAVDGGLLRRGVAVDGNGVVARARVDVQIFHRAIIINQARRAHRVARQRGVRQSEMAVRRVAGIIHINCVSRTHAVRRRAVEVLAVVAQNCQRGLNSRQAAGNIIRTLPADIERVVEGGRGWCVAIQVRQREIQCRQQGGHGRQHNRAVTDNRGRDGNGCNVERVIATQTGDD